MRDYEQLTAQELDLYKAKNRDYTGNQGDTYGNFNRVSAILKLWGFDIPPNVVGLIYMLKQLDAAGNMMGNNYEGKVENIDARLTDVHVYAKIIRLLGDK